MSRLTRITHSSSPLLTCCVFLIDIDATTMLRFRFAFCRFRCWLLLLLVSLCTSYWMVMEWMCVLSIIQWTLINNRVYGGGIRNYMQMRGFLLGFHWWIFMLWQLLMPFVWIWRLWFYSKISTFVYFNVNNLMRNFISLSQIDQALYFCRYLKCNYLLYLIFVCSSINVKS